MKKIGVLLFSMFISNIGFTQLIHLKIKETQPNVRYEKTSSTNVLANPEWVGYIEPSICEYVINLKNKTLEFLYEGTSSKDPYNSISIKGEDVHITLKDNAREGSKSFDLQFDYNIKMQTASISWYDKESDFTRTQKFIHPTITKTNK
jgi:hypothetical protein